MKKAKVIGKLNARVLKSRVEKKKWSKPLTVPIGPILREALKLKRG
jgi:hypothetical protein